MVITTTRLFLKNITAKNFIFTRELSIASGSNAIPLLEETIGANLWNTVKKYPDNEALVVVHQNYRATYQQFWDQTTKAALGLLSLDVKKGDRVGIWSPNRYEWVIAQYATARIGAIMVAVNPAYKQKELAYALNLSETNGFGSSDYVSILEDVKSTIPTLKHSIWMENDWQALLDSSSKIALDELVERESSLNRSPKGALLTHRNILNNGFLAGEPLNYSAADRVCIPVPFYHCFGMVLGNLACTSHGSTMVIPNDSFNAKKTLQTVQDERCTQLYGVPTMLISQLDHPEFSNFDLSSLRGGIMAGSICPEALMKDVIAKMHMKDVTIGYGMTETSPLSTQTSPTDSFEAKTTTVGKVHPHVEIKVVDPLTGETVPFDTPGEFCAKGYHVMDGYYGNEEATRNSIDKDGYMHSGDLATMDSQGYVKIVGRIKDLIIRGGENIYPKEIEEFLHSHPCVAEAQVIGIPSYKYGEQVCAWIKPKNNASITSDELIEFCKGEIAYFKIPKYWKIVDSFPLTVTGKVQKYVMRDISTAELGNPVP
ncbi:Fatty-acid-CoA ligase [Globomyces sp. JEL0801]|nr:Fatty-acid-CoA ligase [Globomyces sp. JEL0801]